MSPPWHICLYSQVYFAYNSSDGGTGYVKPDTNTSCRLQVYDQPFDRGSFRNVHWAFGEWRLLCCKASHGSLSSCFKDHRREGKALVGMPRLPTLYLVDPSSDVKCRAFV